MSSMKRKIAGLVGQYRLSDTERAYFNVLKNMSKKHAGPAAPVVLLQCVEDYYYLGLFALIATQLRQLKSVSIEQYVVRNLRPGASESIRNVIRAFVFVNWFTDGKWVRLYSSFCDRVAFRNVGLFVSLFDIPNALRAFRLWKSLDTKHDLLKLHINGISVGDLVYDSYLRFKPAATVNLKDVYLWIIIWQAYRNVRVSEKYFIRAKPLLFFASYSSYIQHGIPVRVALNMGIEVFTLGNYQELAKRLSLQDWFHTRAHEQYQREWLRLSDKERKIADAEQGLAARLAGGVDAATAYMRASAYANTGESVPDVHGALVIFMHDFFDSPHCHQWMLFPDFLEWVEHTIRIAEKYNLKVFWKPHPNQIAASADVVSALMIRHPGVKFLSSRITNRQLVDAGIICALTVYGTVAHEIAYLGVPVIACGDHPHISFDFCFTATTINEYDRLLQNYARLEFDLNDMRRQCLEFYFMHSLNVSSAEQMLLNAIGRYRTAFYSDAIPPDAARFQVLLSAISEQDVFREQVRSCLLLAEPV
ncbi:hypothetical protein [Herbaspirillum lusitanum]|uniref:hypothetical protein n=1 Tax=Herbaspirillum lusitanum TaxID=213312 RepID=UPI000365A0A3|nr:hypothetical protein [Herbaspirillum lusitanum]